MDQALNQKIDAFIAANKEQILEDIAALVAINSVEAVSYTHLDVYKRQLLACLVAAAAAGVWAVRTVRDELDKNLSGLKTPDSTSTVSYTHLPCWAGCRWYLSSQW